MANFGHDGKVAIFQILDVSESRFLHDDNFVKAIAFAYWPILAMMGKLPFFDY